MTSPYAADWTGVQQGIQNIAKNRLAGRELDQQDARLAIAQAAAGREAKMFPYKEQQAQLELDAARKAAQQQAIQRGLAFWEANGESYGKLPVDQQTAHWNRFLGSKFFDDNDRKMFDTIPGWRDPVVGPKLLLAYGSKYRDPLEKRSLTAKAAEDEASATLKIAQADAAKAKPSDTFDLGPGHARYQQVRNPDGSVSAKPVATANPAAPSGFEADPARPGGLRPIAGGPADKITADQAARVALMTEGIKDMPAIREAFGVRIVPDQAAPGGSRIEQAPGEFGVSKAPLGQRWDPVAYAQHYGGLGRVGEGQRKMQSAMEGVLRTLTGAAATKEEVARELTKYMPHPADTLETRASKLALFERNLKSIAQMSAHGTSGTDILEMLKAGGAKAQSDRAPTAQPNPVPPGRQRYRNDQGVEIEWDGKQWIKVN